MAVVCNEEDDTYLFAEGSHKRWDILQHFKVQWSTAEEIRTMLVEAHKRYYGKEPSPNDLFYWLNRHIAKQELPTSVLSLYCKDRGLIPPELAAVA